MRWSAVLLLAGALAGCGSGSFAGGPGPPRPDAHGRLAVSGFNAYLDDYPEYAESPEALAAEFVELGEREATTATLVARANGEVRVTLLGLADDSVADERYELVVEKEGDGWRLRS